MLFLGTMNLHSEMLPSDMMQPVPSNEDTNIPEGQRMITLTVLLSETAPLLIQLEGIHRKVSGRTSLGPFSDERYDPYGGNAPLYPNPHITTTILVNKDRNTSVSLSGEVIYHRSYRNELGQIIKPNEKISCARVDFVVPAYSEHFDVTLECEFD